MLLHWGDWNVWRWRGVEAPILRALVGRHSGGVRDIEAMRDACFYTAAIGMCDGGEAWR